MFHPEIWKHVFLPLAIRPIPDGRDGSRIRNSVILGSRLTRFHRFALKLYFRCNFCFAHYFKFSRPRHCHGQDIGPRLHGSMTRLITETTSCGCTTSLLQQQRHTIYIRHRGNVKGDEHGSFGSCVANPELGSWQISMNY